MRAQRIRPSEGSPSHCQGINCTLNEIDEIIATCTFQEDSWRTRAICGLNMQRIPEPELMEDPVQCAAYANAGFDEPHNMFIEMFREVAPAGDASGAVLDLG